MCAASSASGRGACFCKDVPFLIDSTGILELVSYLESEFGIVVQDEEIVPENLDSVGQIAAYVDMKQAAQPLTAIAV